MSTSPRREPVSKPRDRQVSALPAGGEPQVEAVMAAAAEAGLLTDKSSRISGRVSPPLLAAAKRRTGLSSDSELISYALASLALEDPFIDAFRKARGTVDRDLDLGY